MLARTNRLFSERDYQHVFARGRRFASVPLTLVVAPNHRAVLRCAVVIGTSVTKRATQRNTLRRRITEQIRRLLPTLRAGYDCAFLVRPKALTLSREDLRMTVTILLRRGGILPPLQP